MGRPRKQTIDYFPHFVSTDSRTKFILEQNWGNDGYAFWFKLLELLGRSEGHYYDYSQPADRMYLVALAKVTEDTANAILDMLALRGNIDPELWKERQIIWCQNFVDNLQDVYSKRTVSAPTKPFSGKLESKPEPEKPKNEKPEKESKPKKTKSKRTSCLTAAQCQLFEKFYAAYPKKVDRATAERAWSKIDPMPDEAMTEKIVQAVEASKKYDSRFREKRFTPNPASWLNAKGYLNEYTQEGGNDYAGNYGNWQDPGQFKPSDGFRSGE